jgi:hypothetical protein
MRKRVYERHEGSSPPGRRPTEVSEVARRDGISRQAAWWRLRRASGKRRGCPSPEISALVAREGIGRKAAWWRLRRSTGKPRGRRGNVKISLLVYEKGISRKLAWWRLRRRTGKARGRPRIHPRRLALPPPSSMNARIAELHNNWAQDFAPPTESRRKPNNSWF